MATVTAPSSRTALSAKQRNEKPSRKPSTSMNLRCMAYRRGEEFRAECVDLDLLVSGRTMDEAQKHLIDAIHGYMTVVFSSSDTAGLMPRPSPLARRILYRFRCFEAAISKKRNYILFEQNESGAKPCFSGGY